MKNQPTDSKGNHPAQQVTSNNLLQSLAYNRIKVVNEAVEKVLSLQTRRASPISQRSSSPGGSHYKFVANTAQRLKEFEAKSIQAIEEIYRAVSK